MFLLYDSNALMRGLYLMNPSFAGSHSIGAQQKLCVKGVQHALTISEVRSIALNLYGICVRDVCVRIAIMMAGGRGKQNEAAPFGANPQLLRPSRGRI